MYMPLHVPGPLCPALLSGRCLQALLWLSVATGEAERCASSWARCGTSLFPQWCSGLAGSMPEPEPIALCRWERGLGRRAGWGSAPEVPLSTRSNRCCRDLTGDLVSPHCSETGDGWASAACLVGWVRRVPQEEGACHFRDRHNRWSQVKSLLSTNLHFF